MSSFYAENLYIEQFKKKILKTFPYFIFYIKKILETLIIDQKEL